MVKLITAFFVMLITITSSNASVCKRCHYKNTTKYYPAFSKQLQECILYTEKRLKISLSKSEIRYLNLIISRENPEGDITYNPGIHHGLGQGNRGTYRSTKVPWGIECASEQIEMMYNYVYGSRNSRARYGSFKHAWTFWNTYVNGKKRRWY